MSAGEHFSAATLSAGVTELGLAFEYRKWDEMGHVSAHLLHEAGEHIHNFNHDEFCCFSLARGVTDRLEAGLMMPVVAKTFLRVEDGVVGHGDSSSGAGDLQTRAKIKFLDSPFEARERLAFRANSCLPGPGWRTPGDGFRRRRRFALAGVAVDFHLA